MIFPMLAFMVVLTSAVLNLFGFVPPDGSIFQILFTSDNAGIVFQNILLALLNSVNIFADLFGGLISILAIGAVVGGVMYGRDEPLYGGLGVLIFKMLGLYSVISTPKIPEGLEPIVLFIVGLFNTIFVISFINWIRGKGE